MTTRHPEADDVSERQPRNRAERRHPVPAMAYNVDDTCSALGISRPTFYELVAAGRLHTTKVGRRRLTAVSEIERFLTADARSA
jgi:excisionase family DNA binding protein